MIVARDRLVSQPLQDLRELCTPPEFTEAGLCVDDWRFFDQSFESKGSAKIASDICADICHACPVEAECLAAAMKEEHGLSVTNRYGVRGGKTARQRAAMGVSAA